MSTLLVPPSNLKFKILTGVSNLKGVKSKASAWGWGGGTGLPPATTRRLKQTNRGKGGG